MDTLPLIGLTWFLLACGVAALANSRGRSAIGFLLVSLLLSPLLGLIVVLVMSDKLADERRMLEQRKEHERQLESIRALASARSHSGTDHAGSLADELAKLVALKDSGALSEQEFAVLKAKLLG